METQQVTREHSQSYRNFAVPELIIPQVDKPVFATAENIRDGRLPFGFNGESADHMVILNVAVTANGGPVTQTLQLAEGCTSLAKQAGIEIGYVGPKMESGSHADQLTGKLPTFLGEIQNNGTSFAQRCRDVEDSLVSTLSDLADQGKRNILIASNGYTTIAPFTIKRALENVNANRGDDPVRVNLIIQDSSFPDTDAPSNDLDAQGFPIDRFNPDGYVSNEHMNTFMVLNNWLPVDVSKSDRAPKGVTGIAASFPFTERYIEGWQEWRSIPRDEARRELAKIVGDSNPELAAALLDPEAVIIPLFASNGYFSPQPWMTNDQYRDMRQGVVTLMDTMSELSQRLNKPVIVTGVEGFVNMAHGYLEQANGTHKNIKVFKAPSLPQSQYGLYMRSADLGISRTSQANTSGEIVLAGLPQILFTMPAARYMDVQHMDPEFEGTVGPQAFTEANPVAMATVMDAIITDPSVAAEIVKLQDETFSQVHYDPARNFFGLVSHISGLS